MNQVEDTTLLAFANEARERAYAPYSHFFVGAAVLCSSGNIYGGCNVENAAYPATICAERNALSSAIAAGDRDIVRIVVVADSPRPVSPCGMCRQVIAELAPHASVLLTNLHGATEETTPDALLPGAFGAKDM